MLTLMFCAYFTWPNVIINLKIYELVSLELNLIESWVYREMKTEKLYDFFSTLAPSVVDFYKTV